MTGPDAMSRVQDALDAVVEGSGARGAVLTSPAGAVTALAGTPADADPVVLGSLAAAHLATAGRLASFMGESELRTLVHQGETASILLARMRGDWLLAVLYQEDGHGDRLPSGETLDITDLEAALAGISDGGGGGMGTEWLEAARIRIDRTLREGA